MATAVMLVFCLMLLRFESFPKLTLPQRLWKRTATDHNQYKPSPPAHTLGAGRSGFPSLLDTSLFRTLTTSFLLGFVSLVSIFIIFTLFELWRFIASNHV